MPSMPVPNRFVTVGRSLLAPGGYVRASTESRMLQNALFTFAHARRNYLGAYLNQAIYYEDVSGNIVTNKNNPYLVSLYVQPSGNTYSGGTSLIQPMHIGHSIEPYFTNRVWLYVYSPDWASEVNDVSIQCQIGSQSGSIDIDAVGPAWYQIDVPALKGYEPNAYFSLLAHSKSTRTKIQLLGVCCYQVGAADDDDYVDLAEAYTKIGTDDYPVSTAKLNLLNRMCNWTYAARVPRSNVISHFAKAMGSDSLTYGTTVGKYKFVKRARVATLLFCARCMEITANDALVTVSIKDSGGSHLTNSPQTFVVDTSSELFTTTQITLVGTEATNEMELELTIDIDKNGSGTTIGFLDSFALIEDEVGSSTETAIDMKEFLVGSNVGSRHYDLIRTLLYTTDKISGKKVACSDHRAGLCAYYGADNYVEAVCNEYYSDAATGWATINPTSLDGFNWIRYWEDTASTPDPSLAYNSLAFMVPIYPGYGNPLKIISNFGYDVVAKNMAPDVNFTGLHFICSCIRNLPTISTPGIGDAEYPEFGRDGTGTIFHNQIGLGQNLVKSSTFYLPSSERGAFPAASSNDAPLAHYVFACTTDANRTQYIKPKFAIVYEPILQTVDGW